MDFIRQSTKLNVYDDTTAHCLYGSDADLIMLGMSLKIKKIFIIREEFIAKSKKVVISKARNLKNAKFKIIYVNVLKEYFDLEYRELKNEMKIPYDYQRILNDFVFLCFFIGNDFLPRSYCYDIREGNLDVLINGFKMFLKVCEDYIVHEDHMNLKEL
jgi:5'-3' exoribonuclease 1